MVYHLSARQNGEEPPRGPARMLVGVGPSVRDKLLILPPAHARAICRRRFVRLHLVAELRAGRAGASSAATVVAHAKCRVSRGLGGFVAGLGSRMHGYAERNGL